MKQNEIRINVEEKLTGMFCETIFMIILSCLGHIEWGRSCCWNLRVVGNSYWEDYRLKGVGC